MIQALIISEAELKAKLTEIVHEVVENLFEKILNAHPPAPEVMTLRQLAVRWQVTKQSLLNWVRRTHNPLPVHYVGSDPRFHRSEVNAWSKAEAERQLGKKRGNK